MERVEIRRVSPEDAEALLAIYAPYVRETAITFEYEPPAPKEFRKRISETLRRYPYLAAVREGRIVGYAYAGPFQKRAAYDWSAEVTVYVDREQRRSGVGAALYRRLERALGEMGVRNLYACVASVEEPDEHLTRDSVLFHERMGYVTVGRFRQCGYKFGRWYDMVWMEKIIGEHPPEAENVRAYPELEKR